MPNNIVIYTAIFGPYDGLLPQKKYKGVDYICFTDQPFKSKSWKIVHTEPIMKDGILDNRRIKVLPHLFLKEYQTSIYVDGNFVVRKDPNPLVAEAMKHHQMAAFDHNQTEGDQRNCIYDEAEALISLGEQGNAKAAIGSIQKQMNKYQQQQYPRRNGLIAGGVLIRRHHDPAVIAVMQTWWQELTHETKRDQLSFNYAAWKNKFSYYTLKGNIRNNDFFYLIGLHRKDYKSKYLRYKLKEALGMLKKH